MRGAKAGESCYMTAAQQIASEPRSFHAIQATSDMEIVAALRRGDEAAFVLLLDRYQHAMVRIARIYVGSHAVAEEVVQEAWLGILQGLSRFEGRSSLKTWIPHRGQPREDARPA